MAEASHMLASPWKGDREQWVLAWYRRNDRAIMKRQVFHLPKASYVSQPSTQGQVGRDPEPQAQGLRVLSELRAHQYLAPGLWPSSRLQMRVSHRPATSQLVIPSCAPPHLSFPLSVFPCASCHSQLPLWTAVHCMPVSCRVGWWLPCPQQMGRRDGSWEVSLLPGEEASALAHFPWGKGYFQCWKLQFRLPLVACRGGVMRVYRQQGSMEGTSGKLEFHVAV